MDPRPLPAGVAEVQGLYGPFIFPETLLQKIWAEGDFAGDALQTEDNRRLVVRHPGRWNRLGGPDFIGARWRLDDGPEESGDVELHLRAEDWEAHGHAEDPAYAQVGLHVVLFPPARQRRTLGAGGRPLPLLVLLPWLRHDLEEYAAEAAVERLAGQASSSEARARAMCVPRDALGEELRQHAQKRWAQKRHFAHRRVAALGWETACHQTALEILGYRANRTPMLRVAGRHPLAAWPEASADEVARWAAEEHWAQQAVRPANQPARRLQQYHHWVRARPDWPQRLRELGAGFASIPEDGVTASVRQQFQFARHRRKFAEELTGGGISGARLDTLICDGWLPLLGAAMDAPLTGWWRHWFAGDAPAVWRADLRACGLVGRGAPFSHGLLQGWLGWLLARDADRRGA